VSRATAGRATLGSFSAFSHNLEPVTQIVPRFDFRIECAVAEDKGPIRQQHEDAHLAAPELALFCVADGMGGHAAGEVAARLALEEIRSTIARKSSQRVIDAYVAQPDLDARRNVFGRLKKALEAANQRVRQDAAEHDDRRGMGTTIDVVWLARGHAFIAHAGDGRVYLARARATLQLTQDHAQVESLKATGVILPTSKSYRDRLINAVGLNDAVTVDTLFVDVSRGDRLLLCTDGVHGQIDGEGRLGELLRSGPPNDAARALVRAATARGRDNATALVIEIGDRFVRRDAADRGLAAADLERARQSALLTDLDLPLVLAALAAAVEIEVEPGATVPRVIASDLVSYIVLDGVLKTGPDRSVGTGALLFPESLVGVWSDGELPEVEQRARLLRVRADDFDEVCRSDPALAAELYRRLATDVARRGARAPRVAPGAGRIK
jgi:PPM family protein phosphatase